MTKISVILGDITTQHVNVIVNAANQSLLGGGGVDGAIHTAAGPGLLKECKTLGGCKTGEAKITKGYRLPAKFVIHTVGPVYGREHGNEAKLLANCYTNCLRLARIYGNASIAFPAVATGVYRFPKEEAVKIVKKAVLDFIKTDKAFDEIIFVLHSTGDYQLYKKYFEIF